MSQDKNKKQRTRIQLDHLIKIKPLTPTQRQVFDVFEKEPEHNLALIGSAGSGKSFLAIYDGLQHILDRQSVYDQLLIIRSAVASRDLGFLPGTEDEKLAVFEQPYKDICDELFKQPGAYDGLKEANKIVFLSSSFLRGTTFNNSVVVVDEVQNMTWQELNTIITRIGHNSKIILCGDIKQNDLTRKQNDKSGFIKFIDVISNMQDFFTVYEFHHEDIVRSALVKAFIIECEKSVD